jgi:molybdate transport system substrate-binding protein
VRNNSLNIGLFVLLVCFLSTETVSAESFVIAGSPSLKPLLERLGHGFERSHPGLAVKLYLDSGLDLRQTIAGMENSLLGQYFVGSGPIHLVAPGGDEMITRLEQKYYVLPGTKRPYAEEQLVLVVPESLVEAPESLEDLSRGTARLAIADPLHTRLGTQTWEVLHALDLDPSLNERLDVATDTKGVLDHVLSGQADAGVIYGHDAVRERERLRVVVILNKGYHPVLHSMAMERYCPNRRLCEEFLAFIQSAEAKAIIQQTGYGVPKSPDRR